MSRVLAIAACGMLLSACSSSWVPSMPDMSLPSFSDWSLKPTAAPQGMTVNVESDPPGAEARSSAGGSCRTPCALAVQASGDFTVNVALNGYVTQSVPVRMIPPEDPRFAPEGTTPAPRVDPNPLFVELERAPPPPPPARKKPPPRKRTAAPKPAPAPAPETTMTAAPPPPMQPPPAATAPWPMPR